MTYTSIRIAAMLGIDRETLYKWARWIDIGERRDGEGRRVWSEGDFSALNKVRRLLRRGKELFEVRRIILGKSEGKAERKAGAKAEKKTEEKTEGNFKEKPEEKFLEDEFEELREFFEATESENLEDEFEELREFFEATESENLERKVAEVRETLNGILEIVRKMKDRTERNNENQLSRLAVVE